MTLMDTITYVIFAYEGASLKDRLIFSSQLTMRIMGRRGIFLRGADFIIKAPRVMDGREAWEPCCSPRPTEHVLVLPKQREVFGGLPAIGFVEAVEGSLTTSSRKRALPGDGSVCPASSAAHHRAAQ